MTATQLPLPKAAEPESKVWWLMFPRGTNQEAVWATFEAKYGVEPQKIWRLGWWVYAGPAPKRKETKL